MRTLAAMIAGGALLAGCAAGRPVASASAGPQPTITVSRGPCFGFCPVYTVRVAPDGTILFQGERHTALLGSRSGLAPRDGYGQLAMALAPYRPAPGRTTSTSCVQRASDRPTYRITWAEPDGRKAELTHDLGCRAPANDALNAALDAMPAMLGIGDWARQVTREGAPRG